MNARRNAVAVLSMVLCCALLSSAQGAQKQSSKPAAARPQASAHKLPGAAVTPDSALQLAPATDEHSYGNPSQVRVTHIDLDLTVDFEKSRLSGTATLSLDRKDTSAPLIVDTEKLDVTKVEAASATGRFASAKFATGQTDAVLGAPLSVDLPQAATRVRITYATSPEGSALQWLTPAQTAGGKHPYLFTQNEDIHGRSWLPTQDSPGVRVTYSATIHAPKDLVAVMSAEGNPQPRSGAASLPAAKGALRDFHFNMTHAVPSYLIALAVGDLAFRPLGTRAGVYDEPSRVERDAREFSELPQMISATESLYGPYQWGRYDVLVLPPSFPYGGMENPRLTFASPTIIAGDKSLVSVICHELAHSWSGNYVTNATWSDFWLNEGFTTYIERRIVEAVFGKKTAEEEIVLGREVLTHELATLPPRDQVLHVDLKGRDPDEGQTELPYEKGSLLLRLMEKTYGRQRFDEFLRGYFKHFGWHSITTEDFSAYLQDNLLNQGGAAASTSPDAANAGAPATIDLVAWISQPGLPNDAPVETSVAFAEVEKQSGRYAEGKLETSELKTDGWDAQQWRHFLQAMPIGLGSAKMGELDSRFHFTQSGNIELVEPWLRLAIANNYAYAEPRLKEVLMTVGRMKIILPLYAQLVKTPVGMARAQAYYKEAKPHYHPILQKELDQLMAKPAAQP